MIIIKCSSFYSQQGIWNTKANIGIGYVLTRQDQGGVILPRHI
ncbi:MAG: hypothetical protein K0S39_548 [Paenibacillus sp.]|jgi:hypothetical protein|nr:hypothetical protein [Paenibacillus sp.]